MQMILPGLILAIATAFITSILTYYFTSKSRKDEAIIRFREEKYSKLLNLLEGFVGETASAETKRAFFKEQHESWLYTSDEVTKTINHMLELVKDSADVIHAEEDPIGNIVLAMRKDLLGKTNLSADDFQYIDVIDSSVSKKHNR